MTREEWLEAAVEQLKPLFDVTGLTIPDLKVSCGWPPNGGRKSKNRTRGVCHSAEASEANVPEIFISPMEHDSVEVLDILTHELIHAAGVNGHGKDFRAPAILVGLEGKMTATHAGEWLTERLKAVHAELGDYPHAKLSGTGHKKQPTRLIKVMCYGCGYIVRTTDKWIDTGLPTCPCGHEMEVAE